MLVLQNCKTGILSASGRPTSYVSRAGAGRSDSALAVLFPFDAQRTEQRPSALGCLRSCRRPEHVGGTYRLLGGRHPTSAGQVVTAATCRPALCNWDVVLISY